MTHANAPLTPAGRRRLAIVVVEEGWSLRRAAERFQVSAGTAKRWADRYRAGEPLTDRTSRPARCPGRLDRRTERRIIGLRTTRRWGPHRIAYHLHLARSTVGRVLTRYRMPLLAHLDRATGAAVRRPPAVRYEKASCGELVHVDIKKQGRIPDGGGWRIHGAGSRQHIANGRARYQRARAGKTVSGYRYLHHAVDDHSRLAYSEILDAQDADAAAGFMARALDWFSAAGIAVTAVMTDNGWCYRSKAFTRALGPITHVRTRPYRPQTNGKVERFNRTPSDEWAYARAYYNEEDREQAYYAWIHEYNHHRPHTSLNGLTPSDRVPNLAGKNN